MCLRVDRPRVGAHSRNSFAPLQIRCSPRNRDHNNMASSVTDRFLRYVVIDTQSDASSKTQPSTEKQKDLGRLLIEELLAIGVSDAHLDEHGYVYATIPSDRKSVV